MPVRTPIREQGAKTTRGPSVQGWVLPHLIDWAGRLGLDGASVRRLPGLTDLGDPDLRVPEASVEAAWRLATGATHDEAIGVHLAESLPRGALDLVEYAFRSSSSLAPDWSASPGTAV